MRRQQFDSIVHQIVDAVTNWSCGMWNPFESLTDTPPDVARKPVGAIRQMLHNVAEALKEVADDELGDEDDRMEKRLQHIFGLYLEDAAMSREHASLHGFSRYLPTVLANRTRKKNSRKPSRLPSLGNASGLEEIGAAAMKLIERAAAVRSRKVASSAKKTKQR